MIANRKQIISRGNVRKGYGAYYLRVTIDEQKPNGYWSHKYKSKNLVSIDFNKLNDISVGYQYFGEHWKNK